MSGDPSLEHADAAYGVDTGGVLAVFHTRVEKDEAASLVKGSAVFTSEAFVKIIIPGDNRGIQVERLNEGHKRRWPDVWRAFAEKRSGAIDGTPINEFVLLSAVQVAQLRASGIVTVEQLANVSDSKLSMALPRELRERARQFLRGSGETEKELRKENLELRGQLESLTAQFGQMQAALARLEAERPKEAEPEPDAAKPKAKAA